MTGQDRPGAAAGVPGAAPAELAAAADVPRALDLRSQWGTPDLRPGPGRAASAPAMIAAQLAMELRLTARRGENLLATLGLPVILLVFFATVPLLPDVTGTAAGRGAAETPADAASRVASLLPGILAIAIVAASLVNLGIATAFERGYGVLKRLGGSPLPRGGLLAAKLGAVAVVEAVQLALLVGVAAFAFGWSPGPGWSPVLAIATVLVGSFTFAALGLLLAGTLRPEAALAIVNALFIGLMLLGGLLVPAAKLPGLLGDLARLVPGAPLAEALRAALGAPGAPLDAVAPLVLVALWGLAAAFLATRTFRWE